MATLIENIYCPIDVSVDEIFKTKIKDLSYFQKVVLGISNFQGYQDNSIFDVVFMLRIPLQMVCCKYKRLINGEHK